MSRESETSQYIDTIERYGTELAESLRKKLLDATASDGEKNTLEVHRILNAIEPSFLTHHLVRRLEKQKVPVRKGLSFHQYMIEESEARKLGEISPSWRLNRKTRAYRFMDELGIRRPATTAGAQHFSELSFRTPSVVKAESGTGGRGTYLVFSDDRMRHVGDGREFSSWGQLTEHAYQLMNSNRPIPNRWIVEELILEDHAEHIPARDSKFFCFYGEVLFSLDVVRSEQGSQYAFSLPDGTSLKPGDWDYTYFDSAGPTRDQVELAQRISSAIPHPFMRIDMLLGEGELVFGEFTPRPGQFQRFNPEWDRRMGEAWMRAKNRLFGDLLAGKRFEAYEAAVKSRR